MLFGSPWDEHRQERFSVLPSNDGRILCFGETINLLFDVTGVGFAWGSNVPEGRWHTDATVVRVAESFVSACLQIIHSPNRSDTLVYCLPYRTPNPQMAK